VKGADGKLHLSKNTKAFHTVQGVYRSSYKNAMRLTRTETNAAYRLADQDRWQRMDFVVGMRVHKSNNHPTEDICNVLAGDYPKTFKFSAWHPQCHCYVTSILCTKEEMMQMQRDILAGKSTNGFRSVNEVRTVPKAFTDWIDANGDRIMRAKALPYFLKDNGKNVDGKWVWKDKHQAKMNNKIKEKAESFEDIVKSYKPRRTDAETYATNKSVQKFGLIDFKAKVADILYEYGISIDKAGFQVIDEKKWEFF
jgi:hypothetical protein